MTSGERVRRDVEVLGDAPKPSTMHGFQSVMSSMEEPNSLLLGSHSTSRNTVGIAASKGS